MCRTTMRRCFENDSLSLYTVWHADRPIAALTCYVDRPKRTVSAHTIAWDQRFAKLSPGNILAAYTIQDAIQNGMQVYDLLRGDEGYKFERLGAVERSNTSIFITRKSLRMAVAKLIAGS
jgi:CelD/BcsL family acetyltransferase involved in cellulose biosynthesis